MVEKIYEMKNKFLNQAEKELAERGPERIDVNRMGEIIDMVKDLAEAEESCWKAAYYRKVTEAMEGASGYPMATTGNPASGGGNIRAGYGMQSARQGYGSMGHGDVADEFIEKMATLSPEEKMMAKNRILSEFGRM
jgi:hypothetical protein